MNELCPRMEEKNELFWKNLEEKLKVQGSWPQLYMFKFIVPADNSKIARVENLFDAQEAQINRRSSSGGKYISITAKEVMTDPDKVIERYKEASKIEGLMAL